MNRAELREAEMTKPTNRKNRVTETVKAVVKVRALARCTSLKRGVKKRKILCGSGVPRARISRPECRRYERFASGFFEEKSRGETQTTKPTKERRKDAEAAQ
jgi:hypothetical protein